MTFQTGKEFETQSILPLISTIKISEKLLKGKKCVNDSIDMQKLDKIWCSSNTNAAVQKTEISNCTNLASIWVLRQTPPISEYYELGDVVGTPGTYGVVHKASSIDTKEKFAIKSIRKFKYKCKASQQSFFSDLRSEVSLMRESQQHPNCIDLYQVFEDLEHIHLVLKYCNGGELFEHISAERHFSEQKASLIFQQMCAAIYYLHSLGIAHCDLKPENFVFESKEDLQSLMLIDFGMAKVVQFRKYHKKLVGTAFYVAPEVLNGTYNESADIWSLGICLFVMIFGYPPFFQQKDNRDKNKNHSVYHQILNQGFIPKVKPGFGNYFPQSMPVSSECRDIICRLLRSNTADRITAEECLEHPWLKNAAKNADTDLLYIVNPAIINSLKFALTTNLKQCSALQKEVLSLLSECNFLNKNQRISLQKYFVCADSNKDGKIQKSELFAAISKIDENITAADIDSIFFALDANEDGNISYGELLSSRINRKLQSREERLKKIFDSLDYDGDGMIDAKELSIAWQSVHSVKNKNRKSSSNECNRGIEELEEIIKEVDINGDHKINYQEFLDAFGKLNT